MSKTITKCSFPENNFHVLRKVNSLNMQNNFVFVDTESKETQINDTTKELKFYLGCAILWNRDTDKTKKITFYDTNEYWDNVEQMFTNERTDVIMYAHNTQFDMKMLNGFSELFKRGWELDNHYIRQKVFIMVFKKGDYTLHIWDTTNYVPYPLKSIGNALGMEKLDIDFDSTSDKYLEVYCMRDTEIIFEFVKRLITFLLEFDLTKLKATAGSISFSTFKHKFYNPQDKKIWIHDWKYLQRIERESYRGGITDNFYIGGYENVYKTDINSMYPAIMKEIKVPVKCVCWTHESSPKIVGKESYSELTEADFEYIDYFMREMYHTYINTHCIIAKCTIDLPKQYAYILNDFGNGKSQFSYGKGIEITLCTPELEFVEKYGSITKIHVIGIYEGKNIFSEFVDFFYELKTRYKKENNDVYQFFVKLILNSQYGKWGQYEYKTEQLHIDHRKWKQMVGIINALIQDKLEIVKNNDFVYLGSVSGKEIYIIDKKLFLSWKTNNNSHDSFVAIASHITSYARMMLVDYIFTAKRENTYYCDTDSLFVNQEGWENLQKSGCIDEFELGKLKLEGFGKANFYVPKFYDFYDYEKKEWVRKCKGIKKNSVILLETDDYIKYSVESWDKFKTDAKKGNLDKQIIRNTIKVMSKHYDKGKINTDNSISPFHISEIKG